MMMKTVTSLLLNVFFETKFTTTTPFLKCQPTLICDRSINPVDDLNKFNDKK